MVEERQLGTDVTSIKEAKLFEESITLLWERVRAAAGLIAELRTERQAVLDKLDAATAELSSLRAQLQTKEQEARRLKSELTQSMNASDTSAISSEEKEILKGRIRELIAKINSHL